MPSHKHLFPVPGSERPPVPGATSLGPVDPQERLEVTLVLRPPGGDSDATSFRQQRPLGREEFLTVRGARPQDLTSIESFAGEYGLDVVRMSAARRNVVLAGTAAVLNAAFGVQLTRYLSPSGAYRSHSGPVFVSQELGPIVAGVLGLDDRRSARPYIALSEDSACGSFTPIYYTVPQLAQLYNLPTGLTGQGQRIAILEFGGGFQRSDLQSYFGDLNIPLPNISTVSIDGQTNQPSGDPNNNYDEEVTLDIEVAGALAPGAQLVLYFAPWGEKGWFHALTTAVDDFLGKGGVISISWGNPESKFSGQFIQCFNEACYDAALLGVTICAASGDSGSSDQINDGHAHVEFPASSPFVLGCGGTRLVGSGSTITSEVVWNDQTGATGGGISDVFPLPSYQADANVPPSVNPEGHVGRGVPDVAGNADRCTGVQFLVDGQRGAAGGTSAVAPFWAGLLALINARLGQPVGLVNVLLYEKFAALGGLNDITSGNNGAYQAGPGWDACTGLGSPNGAKLLGLWEENQASLRIRPLTDQCGVYGVEGQISRFLAELKDIPPGVSVTYQWSVIGAQPVSGPGAEPYILSIRIPNPPAGPVTLSVTVTFDQAQLSASFTFTPTAASAGQLLVHLCNLLHEAQRNLFINPLWDPLRNLVVDPLSLADIREMSRLASELSDRTRAVLRDWELANAGSGR